jgi:SAM-dependent methyltransferase
MMDPWYVENLVCPVDQSSLVMSEGALVSQTGRRYPVVDGIPVMVIPDRDHTLWVGAASARRARDEVKTGRTDLYLDTVGVTDEERTGISRLFEIGTSKIDPVVMFIIAQTNGFAYKHLIGQMDAYPIPEPPLLPGNGKLLLDLGCNWGRWCIAAARKGYSPVGIDPSLGAVLAARRVTKQMNLNIRHVVADARYLPFKSALFDTVFSNGVIQHFSKENALLAFASASRVLKDGGTCLIQMATFLGIRSLQHQLCRGFRKARDFEVRYWSVPELKRTFQKLFEDVSVSSDCFFGLGLQRTDQHFMRTHVRGILMLSEGLKKLSTRASALHYIADSVYISAVKAQPHN